jgi:phage gp36-like protein
MYITPAQLADKPGARELAQVATRERDAIVADDLMEATLRVTDRSMYTAPQIAIADDALARISAAIVEAGGIIDGFLAKRYTMPLTTTFPLLTAWARSITRYLLHKDRISGEANDPILRDYRDAMKLLQLTADNKFSLGADDPVVNNPQSGDIQIVQDAKVFGRGETRSFR